MHTIKISQSIQILSKRLAFWRTIEISDNYITLEFGTKFVSPAILVMITSWALEMRQRGVKFFVMAQRDVNNYMDRMGFHKMIGACSLGIPQYAEAGRFSPIKLIGNSSEQKIAVDSICELILKQFDNARALIPAFEWAINEITDNVLIHAQSPTPCAISAQYYPTNKCLEIAIADQGLGLLGTLGPSHDAKSAREAIDLALTRGLTRDTKIGQGNGLAGTEAIADYNGGEFLIWSGDAALVKSGDQEYRKFSNANGVGIALRLMVDNPVDLSNLWIGERHYCYIDYCVQRIENGDALLIKEECESLGSRAPARRLRNKVTALLPDAENPIVLDFKNCNDPSSSFLDELFGRLIVEIGMKAYSDNIIVQGLEQEVLDRANVVIHQRLAEKNDLEEMI